MASTTPACPWRRAARPFHRKRGVINHEAQNLGGVALLCAVATTTSAASLAITRASWNSEKLYVSGSAPGGASVTIANAATGVAIGTAKVEDNGRWKAVFENLAGAVRVRASRRGRPRVERAVSGGALELRRRDTTKSLASLPSPGRRRWPREQHGDVYAATASFSDGTTQNVTAAATWSENSSYATIAAGVLTTAAVSSDQTVTISSSYTSGGVTRTATLSVTVQNAPAVTGSHAGRFTSFEGTKTCLTCHLDEAMAFHGSVHYQWSGDASESDGLGGAATAGKMGGINDFCIYPDINWLGKLTTADGRSWTAAARAATPASARSRRRVASQAQLENIDCLICHSPCVQADARAGSPACSSSCRTRPR